MVYIDGDRLQDKRGIGIIMVIWLLGGEPFYTPLPACLCPVLSSGPARPFRILHKAEMFSWKYQFVLIYHLYHLEAKK